MTEMPGKYPVRYGGVSIQVCAFTIPNGEPDLRDPFFGYSSVPFPAVCQSGSFDSRVNASGRLGRDEAFDGNIMVGWSCSYGTYYGGVIVGTFSYFAF